MNGCFDRRAFAASMPVQSGWYMDGHTRTPRMVSVAVRGQPGCQYTLSPLGQTDPGCVGCKHHNNTLEKK